MSFGDVIHFSNVMAPRHEFVTANNQIPYVFVVFDLRDGPLVLEVPPVSDTVALFGSGIDSWEVASQSGHPDLFAARRGRRFWRPRTDSNRRRRP